jgi:hypothetical protein
MKQSVGEQLPPMCGQQKHTLPPRADALSSTPHQDLQLIISPGVARSRRGVIQGLP